MSEKVRSTLIAAFPTLQQANAVIEELLRADFKKENIGFVMRRSEGDSDQQEAEELGNAHIERTAGGAIAGGVLGGLIGALAALLVPGIGPVASAGMLLAGGGAIAGGFGGLISSLELSEDEVRWYEAQLIGGRPLVFVRTNGRYAEALAIMQIHGGYDMFRRLEVGPAQDEPSSSGVGSHSTGN